MIDFLYGVFHGFWRFASTEVPFLLTFFTR